MFTELTEQELHELIAFHAGELAKRYPAPSADEMVETLDRLEGLVYGLRTLKRKLGELPPMPGEPPELNDEIPF